MQIEFGAFAPPFEQQLAGLGFRKGDLDKWQLIAKSLTVLHIHGYISQNVRNKGERRIIKDIEKKYKELLEPSEVSE
jgi:hypothetical protein